MATASLGEPDVGDAVVAGPLVLSAERQQGEPGRVLERLVETGEEVAPGRVLGDRGYGHRVGGGAHAASTRSPGVKSNLRLPPAPEASAMARSVVVEERSAVSVGVCRYHDADACGEDHLVTLDAERLWKSRPRAVWPAR